MSKHLPHKTAPTKFSTWILRGVITMAILLTMGIVIFFILIAQISTDLPRLKSGTLDNVESTIIYDREGNVLYTIHGEENRTEIPLSNIPPSLVNATLAIEDDQFFHHFGIDFGGIIKAFLSEIGIGKPRGGSTITQQLVKNTLLTSERTFTRKLKEILLAIQVERTFSKNEILERYFNTIPYGSNAYGAEMAAKIYFDKSARSLTLAESAILAALPQAPSRYSPYGPNSHLLMGYFQNDNTYVPGRKDIVLMRMEELGFITREERLKALEEAEKITFRLFRQEIKYPHFVLYVKDILENKFGKEAVETGGLKVYTTIDPYLQNKAEQIVEERTKNWPEQYGVHNTSLFSVDMETGQILAMIGSADYFNEEIDGNVNMVLRSRLPGSSFKPIVYAAGIAKGYSPATVLFDLETDFGNNYIPNNYDGTFSGPVSMRQAIARSLNIPAVKMTYLAGVDNILMLAKKMGIETLKDADQYGLSLGLGTGETTLYQMVKAFSVFGKGGKKMEFSPLLRIEDANGKIIESFEENQPETQEVLDPQIAYTINHMLSDTSARPDAWNITLQIPDQITAVKTGTSNKKVREGGREVVRPLDTWTIGYTTRIITGVWAGNNDSTPVKYEAAGFSTAGKIWHDYMVAATLDKPLEEFLRPKGITWRSVSRLSGKLPSAQTPPDQIISELFTSFNIPEEIDDSYQAIEIDRVSKKLQTTFTPPDAKTKAIVAKFHSLRPDDPNWENPVQEWTKKNFSTDEGEIIARAPTEFDDVHNAQTALTPPTIQIVSPTNNAIVSAGSIFLQPEVSGDHGILKVEYYLQERLVDTKTEFPFMGELRIVLKRKKPYKITAKIFDTLYYTSSDTINIVVDDTPDTTPPQAKITFPIANSTFTPGQKLTIQTQIQEDRSTGKVSFFLNSQNVGEVTKFPYFLPITLPTKTGTYQLRILAADTKGNIDDDTMDITISPSSVNPPDS